MGIFSDSAKAVATVAVTTAQTIGGAVGYVCDMTKPIVIGAADTACKVAELADAVVEPVIKTTASIASTTTSILKK